MNCKIPFTKDIDFERKLYEITSISLEHDYHVEDQILKGNFIVSGDFKSHEVSVNKEPFSYMLPFEIDLNEDIDPNTIEFMIEDFTYEVIDQRILRVNIDFNVIASQKEQPPKEEETREEVVFSDVSKAFEVEDTSDDSIEDRENMPELLNPTPVNPDTLSDSQTPAETKEVEDTIINNINDTDNEYATYHIHMVSDGETVETICTMYNSTMNILSEYNDLNNLNPGDKLIIPESNE